MYIKKPITHTHARAHASLAGQNNESQASMRTCVCLSWPTSFDYVKKRNRSCRLVIYIYQRSVNREAYFGFDTHFFIPFNLNLHVNLASLGFAGITVLSKI